MLRARDGAEAVLGRRQHAAEQQVGDFGGGDVEHAAEQAAVGQLFHRRPPVPVAWKTRQS